MCWSWKKQILLLRRSGDATGKKKSKEEKKDLLVPEDDEEEEEEETRSLPQEMIVIEPSNSTDSSEALLLEQSTTTTQQQQQQQQVDDNDVFAPLTVVTTTGEDKENNDNANLHDDEEEGEVLPSTTTMSNHHHGAGGLGRRLIFLDNLKTFLTFWVVTFHVCCAFGACRGFWFLIVGEESVPKFWSDMTKQLAMLLQGFFMPLFFFVSAYFVPASYHKTSSRSSASSTSNTNNSTTKALHFYCGKRKKLYYPAIFVILTLVPLCIAIGNWIASQDNPNIDILYIFMPGHCWFNLWLLTLHWVYVTIETAIDTDTTTTITTGSSPSENNNKSKTSDDDDDEEEISPQEEGGGRRSPTPSSDSTNINNQDPTASSTITTATTTTNNNSNRQHQMSKQQQRRQLLQKRHKRPFPSTLKRMTTSLVFCGILLIPILALVGPITFAGMPMLHGSLTCDLYMYTMGIMARNNGWLSIPLREQMDIPTWFHRCIVLVESIVLIFIYQNYNLQQTQNIIPTIIFFLTSGMYTVDMGLMLVEIFQSTPFLNQDNIYSRFGSKASYTVYLIHPLVIVVISALYLQVDDTISFENSNPSWNFLNVLAPPGYGGEDHYATSFFIVLLLSQIIVWPMAYCIASMPYLKTFL